MSTRSRENIQPKALPEHTEIIDPYQINLSEINPTGSFSERRKYVLYRFVNEGKKGETYDPLLLKSLKGLWLRDGKFLTFTPQNLDKIPGLINSGRADPIHVLRLGYARALHGETVTPQTYHEIFTAAEQEVAKMTAAAPSQTATLEARLAWTLRDPSEREDLAREKRQETTDRVRSVLIPRYHKRGFSFLSQVRLIHRAHMKGNEHLVLNTIQAKKFLRNDLLLLDRLGGKIRNKESMPIDIYMGKNGTLCISHKAAPELLAELSQKAETLFPLGGKNDKVDEQTIYHFLSAIQFCMAIIHPFYEGNGRTSEDLMYILWQRRPDLAETVRYVSPDGHREAEQVEKRMEIIEIAAGKYQRSMGILSDTSQDHSGKRATEEITRSADEAHKTHDSFSAGLHMALLRIKIGGLIDRMDNIDDLRRDSTIDLLAENLRSASPTYTLRDGTVLGRK